MAHGEIDADQCLAKSGETPPRKPAKRQRAEVGREVLSLVDSDDDADGAISRPRDDAAMGSDRLATQPGAGTHWGALDGLQGPDAQGAAGGRPLYRPPSARFRRPGAMLPPAQQNQWPGQATAASPIVIDDEDESEDTPIMLQSVRRVGLLRRLGEPGRQPPWGMDGAAGGSNAAAARAPRLLAGGGGGGDAGSLAAMGSRREGDEVGPAADGAIAAESQPGAEEDPQQQLLPRPRRPLVLPLPRHMRRAGAPTEEGGAAAGLQGGGNAAASVGAAAVAGAAAAAAGAAAGAVPSWRFRFHALNEFDRQQQQQPEHEPRQQQGQGQDLRQRQRQQEDLGSRLLARMQTLEQQAQEQANVPSRRAGHHALMQHRHLRAVQQQQQQRGGEQAEAAEAGGGPAAGAEGGAQEDEDMRLAARLQAEEDERSARDTARRMEQEEHRRMMAVAVDAAGSRRASAAAARSPREGRRPTARPRVMFLCGATGAPAAPAPAAAAGAPESAPARPHPADASAAARSRLEMFETLEETMGARSRQQAAAAGDSERAGSRGRGGPGERDLRDREREREFAGPWERLSRSMRGLGGTGPGAGGAGAGAGAGIGPGRGLPAMFLGGYGGAEAAAAAAIEAEAAAAAAARGGPGAGAGPGLGERGPGGRFGRWGARAALHEMLPMMAFGLHRAMGGPPGDGEEGQGPYQSHRRARHAAAAAYREQAMAMREQVLGAQRAGLPPHLLLSDRDFTPEDYEMLCRLDDKVENRKGAKEEQLAALPTEVLSANNARRRSDGAAATCSICLEELAPGDTLKRPPCAHEFHEGCLDTWLKTKACCPICQRALDG